jgi:hypothetical protein
VQHYHTDNGRFVDNAWWQDAYEQGQRMTMFRVNAHHQNGKVERRIRELHDLGRSSLLSAVQRWPDAIATSLWPYAIRKAACNINDTPTIGQMLTPTEKFAKVNGRRNPSDKHPFGCPMYILRGILQKGGMLSKWEARARIAVYLGPSMHHASNIGWA